MLHLGLFSQLGNDLYIFGTLQGMFFNEQLDNELDLTVRRPSLGADTTIADTNYSMQRSTFAVQQFDLFLNKYWDDNMNLFVDLEFTLNYDSKDNWGSFALREAWFNYEFSQQVKIKAGQFFPAFNNLNEIKNRLNLINYIFRPIVYERLLEEIIDPEDFIPERAFLQFHGVIPTKSLFFDWAVYIGNSESSFLSNQGDKQNQLDYLSGVDFNDLEKKLYGTRLGIRTKHEELKLGVSFTHDYNNGNDLLGPFESHATGDIETINVNDQQRFRIGADFGLYLWDFYLETEYILSELEDFQIDNPAIEEFVETDNAWNQFYYITLHYDFFEDFFVYGGYSNIATEILGFISDASYSTIGGGWRATESTTLKIQYINYQQNLTLPLIQNDFQIPFARLENHLSNNMFILGFTTYF